jgi:hypothetical protein
LTISEIRKFYKITQGFHECTRLWAFVETTISNSAGKDFAEWFLGHSQSPYWKTKPEAKREFYLTKCVQHLTFLDYSWLETSESSNEAGLLDKDKQIEELRAKMAKMEESQDTMRVKDKEFQGLKEQVEEIQDLYQNLIKTLNEAVDLREKIRANPQEFLEAEYDMYVPIDV